MPFSKERCLEIKKVLEETGSKQAASEQLKLSISSITQSQRMLSVYEGKSFPKNNIKNSEKYKNKVVQKILDSYTKEELFLLSEGKSKLLHNCKKLDINFSGNRVRLGVLTDTHIGHEKFIENRLFAAFEEFKKEKVDFICHCGDVSEGMSHRAGHIYELTHLGYNAQKKYIINLFSQWTDTPIYAIDGNHDRWYIKSNGALIVKDIADSIPNFNFIGHDEGNIIVNGLTINLWHGEDGNSYALSYRVQKIIESLQGGEKPHIMFCGHTHKYVKLFERNIHAISVGCIEDQSSWMRSKRIAAHTGFGIYDIIFNDLGVVKLTETWYPFY